MTSFRRPRARSSALALVLAAGSLAAVVAAPIAPAQAEDGTVDPLTGETLGPTTSFTTAGESVYTVPEGTYALQVTAVGSAGSGTTGNAGRGAKIVSVIPAIGLDQLYVNVAATVAANSQLGGKASSVQTCSSTSESCVYTAGDDDPRLVVAGGGGGTGKTSGSQGTASRKGGDAGDSGVSGPGRGGLAANGRNGGVGSVGETGGSDGQNTTIVRSGPGFGAPSSAEGNGAGGDGWTGGGMGFATGGVSAAPGGGGGGSSFSIGFTALLETTSEAPSVTIAPVYRTPFMLLDVNPLRFQSGQTTTISATVNGDFDGNRADPTDGTVSFKVGTTVLCANVAMDASSVARCTTKLARTTYINGGQQITVVFTPAPGRYLRENSATQQVTIDAGATTNTLKYANKKLTATVKAKAPASGAPVGTVDFKVNGKKIKSVPLKNGVAVLAYTTKKKVTVTAAFFPSDLNFTGSDSAKVTVKP